MKKTNFRHKPSCQFFFIIRSIPTLPMCQNDKGMRAVWRDLAKVCHFGKNLKVWAKKDFFWGGDCLKFDKIMNLLLKNQIVMVSCPYANILSSSFKGKHTQLRHLSSMCVHVWTLMLPRCCHTSSWKHKKRKTFKDLFFFFVENSVWREKIAKCL